jgi:uncharacterized repeat protein (TIGR03803 family)
VRNGTLYGTTIFRSGSQCYKVIGCGTVFSITPSGHETVLYGFAGSPDGSQPEAPLHNVNGTLYGTTASGGVNCGNCGTVFSITPGGGEKVLYSFAGPPSDGFYPGAGVTNVGGTLYGTTDYGGAHSNTGTVFSITPGGKEKVLHSFGNGEDGAEPETALVEVNGTLYGTTFGGGAHGQGTVFSITPSGTEKVLYSFVGGNDGASPAAALLNVNGTLYGTTAFGAVYGSGCSTYGCGTVFSITLSGHETVLHHFMGGQDGSQPYSGLSYVNGTFYGTTFFGGAHGLGTVYSITL